MEYIIIFIHNEIDRIRDLCMKPVIHLFRYL